MSYTASRNFLYAVLSSIESDLREAIRTYLGSEKDFAKTFSAELLEKTFARFQNEHGMSADEITFSQLVDYLDFDDSFKILNRNRANFAPEINASIKDLAPYFQKLAPIRNRVMHSRPLELEDLPTVKDLKDILLAENPVCPWNTLKNLEREMTANPAVVLGFSIPVVPHERISHNLPASDFDETGFVGRKLDEIKLLKLIKGPYPVISIIGEGGIGKTALVLKVAYSILDDEDETPAFDTIVWATAKAHQITASVITRISGAITDSLGMLRAVRDQVSPSKNEDPVGEIIEYLTEFKILLILDNLETVKDDRMVSFFDQLPAGSKVIITSRIGLGEFERRLPLDQMSEVESSRLLRTLLQSRGIRAIDFKATETLVAYCNKLKHNPGYIKWFVSSLETGKRPEEILNQSAPFLDYCMNNVYEYLGEDSKVLVRALQGVSRQLSQAELAFLTTFQPIRLQTAMQQLMTTPMIRVGSFGTGLSAETNYSLSDLSREYLMTHHPLSKEDSIRLRAAYASIQQTEAAITHEGKTNRYSFYSIAKRSKGEVIVGKYLHDAISAAMQHKYALAQEKIDTARTLSPQYYEVHRVAAMVHVGLGDHSAADECYEAALNYEPNSAPLHYWYGSFLSRHIKDSARALAQFELAAKLDPHEAQIPLEKARTLYFSNKLREAEIVILPLLARRLPNAVARKVYDLQLQCLEKEASVALRQKDHPRALSALEKLAEARRILPAEFYDSFTLKTIKRACATIEYARGVFVEPATKEKVNMMFKAFVEGLAQKGVTWSVENVPSDFYGVIVRTMNNYGFIQCDDKKEYYFAFWAIKSTMSPGDILQSRRVRFEMGANQQGVCAINVRFLDQADDQDQQVDLEDR